MNDEKPRSRADDEQIINDVARSYLESWLDGDGERMRSSLSPKLAKRGLDYGSDLTATDVHHLDAEYMVDSAARGPRRQFARTCTVEILDIADNIASVKVTSEPFIDYLHLAKLNGQWSIVNVLYEDRNPTA